jgi:hypothetical protein
MPTEYEKWKKIYYMNKLIILTLLGKRTEVCGSLQLQERCGCQKF